MKVLGNRILILPDNPNAKLAPGALWTPEPAGPKTKPATGVIMALGSARNLPKELKVGQRVRVDTSYGSVEVKHKGKLARIVSTRDVLAILG